MYKRCSVCVMDNANDKKIVFDEYGKCSYCSAALKRKNSVYFPDEEGEKKIEEMLLELKSERGRYDCVMGLSGGLDSSYLAMLGKKWDLKVLTVHIDDGFDTDISKQNLDNLVKACGFDLVTVKPDKEQYLSLIKAYMRAGVANIAVPQDNILFAELYRCIKKYRIKHFLAGGNFATESILSTQNTHSAYDVVNIRDISAKYNDLPINKLRFISSFQRMIDKKLFGIKTTYPLNYIDYRRDKAIEELHKFCGFQYYGSKHLENILTAFIQLYWFPEKFSEDKRKAHYSSLIVSGQMTREEALTKLKDPICNAKSMEYYVSFVKNELGFSDEIFNDIMNRPTHSHDDFKTEDETIMYKLINYINTKIK